MKQPSSSPVETAGDETLVFSHIHELHLFRSNPHLIKLGLISICKLISRIPVRYLGRFKSESRSG
jgi:hypothetical protein